MEKQISVAEKEAMQSRLTDWLLPKNLDWARGKTRNEIFTKFGNELVPIAYIDSAYLSYLGRNIHDCRVYSGMGYFIDHAVNHHAEVKSYAELQNVLSNPDRVVYDNRINKGGEKNNSLMFIKKINRSYIEVISVEKREKEKLVVHKTYHYSDKKNPHKGLPEVRISTSFVVGQSETEGSTINPIDKSTVGSLRFSALNDNTKIQQ